MALPTIALPILSRKETIPQAPPTGISLVSAQPSDPFDSSVTGFEVMRGGQGFSTRNIQPGDIVLKTLRGGTSQRRSEQLRLAGIQRERERQAALERQRMIAEERERQRLIAEAKAQESRQAKQQQLSTRRRLFVARATGGRGFSSQAVKDKRRRQEAQIKEFAFGETGKRFVGFGSFRPVGFTTATPTITAKKTKRELRKKGLKGKVVAEFIPETPGEVAIIGGTAALFPALPTVARVGVGGAISFSESKRVFSPSLSPEKRIASGIIGVAAGLGTTFEAVPFIKGQAVKLSPKFKAIKTQPQGFKAVSTKKPIGIIPEKSPAKIGLTKDVKLPKTSPLKRGGFGVKSSEKKLFLGKQDLATSQIGLFKEGKDIKLTREFFTTPQEPTLKIPETRISRLGIQDPFKSPKIKDVQLGFGIPKQPQIGIETGAIVTKTGKGGTFRIGSGSELESIKGVGTIIKGVKKTGVTTIRGQAVDLFKFKTGKSPSVSKIATGSSKPSTRVSTETLTGVVGSIKGITKTPKTTIKTIKTIRSNIQISPTRITLPTRTTTRTTRKTKQKFSTSGKFISPTRTTLSPKKATVSLPKIVKTSPTIAKSPSKIPKIPTITQTFRTPPTKLRKFKKKTGRFTVFVRRFGKFRSIGRTKSLKQAFTIGRGKVSRTLGASFKIKGKGKLNLGTPLGFRRSKKERGVFIEKRKFRLSKTPEKLEIAAFKRKKKRSKKKK